MAISPEISEAATALDMAIKAGAPINRIIYDDNPDEALRREIRPKELGLFLKICNDEAVSEAMPLCVWRSCRRDYNGSPYRAGHVA